jgi:hypothetical protein
MDNMTGIGMSMLQQHHVFKMRAMFYLVTPNETSFGTLNEVPKFVQTVSSMQCI